MSWMGARAVDWARLESVCTARYRGFESLPIRKSFTSSPTTSNMLPFMRWQRSWFLLLLALAGALVLTSCMNQEGIGAGEGELRDPTNQRPSVGY